MRTVKRINNLRIISHVVELVEFFYCMVVVELVKLVERAFSNNTKTNLFDLGPIIRGQIISEKGNVWVQYTKDVG